MVKITQDRGICILARKRYGKTFLLQSILKELRGRLRVVIYNTDYEDMSALYDEDWCAIITPDKLKVHDLAYLELCVKRMRAGMTNFALVVIDLDAFFEGVAVQTTGAAELRDLWGTGGHQRILPIIESKMPKYLPQKIIDNNNLFYIGQFKNPDDQHRLRGYATPEELESLESPEFIEVDDWTNKRRVVKVENGELTVLRDLPEIRKARKDKSTTKEG